MAKIRGFKPDLWTDEDFVELSPYARLLWLGLWSFACDNGHLADKPKQIKMRVLPTDSVNAADLLDEIEGLGLILRGGGWITVPNLTRHQKPDRRYFTTCGREGCDPPPETLSQRESRRVHGVQTTGTPSAPLVTTPSAQVDGDGDGDGDGDTSRHESADAVPRKIEEQERRDDVEELCSLLAALITENGSKVTVTKGWRDAARLMLDRDGRDFNQALDLIEWSQQDSFWRTNVLSMPTFRKQYNQLRLKSGIDSAPKPTTNGHADPALDPDGYLPGRRRGEADPPILPPPSDMPGQFFRDWNLTNSDRWRRGQNPLTDWRELEQVGA